MMLTRAYSNFLLILLALILTGCIGQPQPIALFPANTLLAIPSAASLPLETVTPLPSAPVIVTTAPIPTLEPAPKPTPTLLPSPIPTRVTLPGHVDVPEWLAAPSSMVVLGLTRSSQGQAQLSFFDVQQKQRFDLLVPDLVGYFWSPDGQQVGLVLSGLQAVMRIELASGSVQRQEYPAAAFRHLPRGSFTALVEVPLQGAPLFIPAGQSGGISPAGKQLAYQDLTTKEGTIFLEDLQTGLSQPLTNAQDGWYDIAFAWAPSGDQIVTLESRQPLDPLHQAGERLEFYTLSQYNPMKSIVGTFAYPQWSPDGRSLLYTQYDNGRYSSYPCILNIASEKYACIWAIQGKQPSAQTSDFRWLPGNRRISFLYTYTMNQNGSKGDLCMYDLDSKSVTCPTHSLAAMQNRVVTSYQVSPDGSRFLFSFDTNQLSDGILQDPQVAVIDENGSNYYWLAAPFYSNASGQGRADFPFDGLWRP